MMVNYRELMHMLVPVTAALVICPISTSKINTASGTWYAAITVANVFYSTHNTMKNQRQHSFT